MSFAEYRTNELIRFKIQQNVGYMDPYSAYFEVEVEAKGSDLGSAALMLDGLSTSIFDQMIIMQNNKEIERIMEYDQLGEILKDLVMHPGSLGYKSYEGGVL